MITRPGFEGDFTRHLNLQLLEEAGWDHETILEKNQKATISLAKRASEQSPHYNHTRFGAIALAVCEACDGRPYFKAFLGNNRSERRGSPKSCAEMGIDALTRWYYTNRASGGMYVPLMTIYGPSDPDRIISITGTEGYQQCPPCHDCLGRLGSNPVFLPHVTKVILANEFGTSEHTLGDLQQWMATVERPLASRELVGVGAP